MSSQGVAQQQVSSIRVCCYIDGFNLYYGIRSLNKPKYKWLDVVSLASGFLLPNQILQQCVFFTSRIKGDPDKSKRQNTYLETLQELNVEIIEGKFQRNDINCKACGSTWQSANEKMTDVNIATRMLIDAYEDKYDVAFLVSGDSDLTPPVKVIRQVFQNKSILVLFPPKRAHSELMVSAHAFMHINEDRLKNCQLPDTITKRDGFIIRRPLDWH